MADTLVIIPTYNAEEFLRRSIDSVLQQSVPTEVWVVDNQSTDGTRTLVEKLQIEHKNIKLYVNEKNLGRIGNWNRCLDLFESSQFKTLKFLFMGDELLPNCVETIDQMASRHPEVVTQSWPYLFKSLDGSESVSGQDQKGEGLLTKEELVRLGLFPSHFLGAIISVALSKKAVVGNRFDEDMIGIVPFYDRALVRGPSYYHKTVLSRFNLDSHRTFFSCQTDYLAIESLYAKISSLENNKTWISAADYRKIKSRFVSEGIVGLATYFPVLFWIKIAPRVLLFSFFGSLKAIKRKVF